MHPQDTVGYWLSYAFRRLAQAFAETLRVHCAERGKSYVITPPLWGVLAVLDDTSGLSMGEIGERLDADVAALTPLIKRLEQSGLVKRVHDHQDRRVVLVALTAEGQNIRQSLDPVVAAFNDRLLPAEQRQVLFASLQSLVARAPGVASRLPGSDESFLEKLRAAFDMNQ